MQYLHISIADAFSDYELVRIYHPDTSVSHALKDPPDIAQARFHAITAAYDNLRGKFPSASAADESQGDVTLRNSEAAMVKARMAARARQAEFLESGGDERWKEWIFMGAIVLVCSFKLTPHTHFPFTFRVCPKTAIAFVAQNFWTRRKLLVEVKSRQLSDHPTYNVKDADRRLDVRSLGVSDSEK